MNKKSKRHIPFNSPSTAGKELYYIDEAVHKKHISANGFFTEKCNEIFKEDFSLKASFLTNSCTHALETTAMLLNIRPGDEIIIPSFTFVSTANAFILRGAKPVFADIREDTLNIDEKFIEELITEKTKAIVPVHYGGVACEMDSIMKIANHRNIVVVEDNAHSLYGKYKSKYLGTFGTFATQSFHETKNISCGEGGALFINDEQYIERAEIILDKGTNRKKFITNQVDKYTWVDFGSSYRLSELNAAFLYGQLECLNVIQKKRKQLWNTYYSLLENWSNKNNIKLPSVPEKCSSSYHVFYLIMPNKKLRNNLIIWLKKNEIYSVFHYIPLHKAPMSIKENWDINNCPVSTKVSDRIIRLPLFYELKISDIEYIVDKIASFRL